MKKFINGVAVELKSTELFKKAFECKEIQKTGKYAIKSDITASIDSSTQKVRAILREYTKYINSLKAPLTYLECDSKYVVFAEHLLKVLKDEISYSDLCISDGLYIKLEKCTVLGLKGDSWGVLREAKQNENAPKIDFELHKHGLGYKEFKCVLESYLEGTSYEEFYEMLVPGLYKACKSEEYIIEHEIENIFNFLPIPKALEIENKRISNLETGYEYFLDVYRKEERKGTDKVYKLRVSKAGISVSTALKSIKVYDFDVYGKAVKDSEDAERKMENKIEKRQIDGMASIFETLLINGIENDTVEIIDYKGIIIGDIIIYEVNNQIYVADYQEYTGGTFIASDCSIHSYSKGKLYLKRDTTLKSGITEETILNYDLLDKSAEICSITFYKKG